MKFNIKNVTLIAVSICTLLPVSLPQINMVKAESLTADHKQNQAIPYPINDPDVIAFRNSCKDRVLREYEGASQADATNICNCILNKLNNNYRYHNSAINLTHFRHLRRDAVNGNRQALDIMEDAGYDCAVESDLLYEN